MALYPTRMGLALQLALLLLLLLGNAVPTGGAELKQQPSVSLVADAYCSAAVMAAPTVHVDFDCLRNASAPGESVKPLGPAPSAAACHAACAAFTYRGLPCRSYTWFDPSYARAAFRGGCFGRIDGLQPGVHAAGATSGSLDLADCANDAHCELNGHCRAGSCECLPGWAGRWCSTLDMRPAAPRNGYRRTNYSSWGGSVARDEQRGLWVMLAAEISGHCGLNEWYLLSRIVRASSKDPEGPYTFEETIVDRLGHQPTLARIPNGAGWLLFHQGAGGNCSNPESGKCANGSTCFDGGPCSLPDSSATAAASQHATATAAADARGSDCMGNFVMRAKQLSGKWSPQEPAGGSIPDNPTAIAMPNGSVILLGRGFGNSNVTGFVSRIVQRRAENWTGPYVDMPGTDASADVAFPDLPAPGWEDGFAWRRKDGTYHAIFHGERASKQASEQ